MPPLVLISDLVKQAKPLFFELLKKAKNSQEKYMNYYGDEDIRYQVFERQFQLNLWNLVEFDNLLDVLNHDNGRVTQYASYSPQDWSVFISGYETTNRTCYGIQAMFSIENCLALIAERLGLTHETYTKIVNQLQTELGLSDFQRKILLAPAYFRNSLHNNGYHRRGDDFDLPMGKEVIHFKKGDLVSGFNIISTYHVFDEMYGVLDSIFETSKVKSQPLIPHNSMTYHDIQ
jgi:hypothetical protein